MPKTSFADAQARTRPPLSTTQLCEMRSASMAFCSIMRMLTPVRFTRSTRSNTSRVRIGERPAEDFVI